MKARRITAVYVDMDPDGLIFARHKAWLVREDLALYILGGTLALDRVVPTSRPNVFKFAPKRVIFQYELEYPDDFPLDDVPQMSAIDFMIATYQNEEELQ